MIFAYFFKYFFKISVCVDKQQKKKQGGYTVLLLSGLVPLFGFRPLVKLRSVLFNERRCEVTTDRLHLVLFSLDIGILGEEIPTFPVDIQF